MSDDIDVWDTFVQYRYNLYNQYLGSRVRIVIKNIKKRNKTFIGTLKGYDLHLNVVLADVYRVILHHTQEQRQDVQGLLVVRGINVGSVTFVDPEPCLYPWPTNHKKPPRNKKPQEPPTPSTPTKPVKLKRSWLTTGSPTVTGLSGNKEETSDVPSWSTSMKEQDEGREEGKGIIGQARGETRKTERGECQGEDSQEVGKIDTEEPETSASAQVKEQVNEEEGKTIAKLSQVTENPSAEDVDNISETKSGIVIKEEEVIAKKSL